jgi:hypothetical protein
VITVGWHWLCQCSMHCLTLKHVVGTNRGQARRKMMHHFSTQTAFLPKGHWKRKGMVMLFDTIAFALNILLPLGLVIGWVVAEFRCKTHVRLGLGLACLVFPFLWM